MGGFNTTWSNVSNPNTWYSGLLYGTRWNGNVITWSAPQSAAQYGSYFYDHDQDGTSAQLEGFSGLTANQYTAARFAFALVSSYTNLNIVEVANTGNATLRLANSSDAPTAYGGFPNSDVDRGDIFFGTTGRNPLRGDHGWHTVLHEIGHTLGLKHPHETYGFGAVGIEYDHMPRSVMSYRSYAGETISSLGYTNEQFGYAQTYMPEDIISLQYLYGANYSTNAADSIYRWGSLGELYINGVLSGSVQPFPSAPRIFMTVWDGGGNDTYDFSNWPGGPYGGGISVDLRPGRSSAFSFAHEAVTSEDGYGFTTAGGNVWNAYMYANNPASLIENAIGSPGDDDIWGNQTNNVLDGRAGSDQMWGGEGDDIYVVDSQLDLIFESANQGVDIIHTSYSGYILFSANVEGLQLIGNAISGYGNGAINYLYGTNLANNLYGDAGDDLLDGGGGNDYLAGGSGADWLRGGDGVDFLFGESGNDLVDGGVGNDIIDGGAGQDIFYGGIGNDRFVVDSFADSIFEFLDQGIDIIETSLNNYILLSSNVESVQLTGSANLTLYGDGRANYLYGNAGNNLIFGDAGGDILDGGAGHDALYTGAGSDLLRGGAGMDSFVFQPLLGHDYIVDFEYGSALTDIVFLSSSQFANITDVVSHMANVGSSVVISIGGSSLTLLNTQISQLYANDFAFV